MSHQQLRVPAVGMGADGVWAEEDHSACHRGSKNSRARMRVRQARNQGPSFKRSLTLKVTQVQTGACLTHPKPGPNAHGNLVSGDSRNFQLARINFPATWKTPVSWSCWDLERSPRMFPFHFSAGHREGCYLLLLLKKKKEEFKTL